MQAISVIVGLGNPGPEYEHTRHNVGAWLVAELARRSHQPLSPERRFFGLSAQLRLGDREVRLLIPATYMNRSGQATAALCRFYRIPPAEMLVVHDELDLAPGTARLKFGGGHGGHNGLRDIIRSQGNDRDFGRLRLGIGHPGHASQVTGHVLSRPAPEDRARILEAIEASLEILPLAAQGQWEQAMNRLHRRPAD